MVYIHRKTKRGLELTKAGIRTKVKIPLNVGDCHFYSFNGLCDQREHIALVFGEAHLKDIPLVRIHSECLTGDVFRSEKCDCGHQLWESLETLNRSSGILLYLRQEGRGIGLYNKLDAYLLQEQGNDTFEANRLLNFPDDLRDYKVAVQMLNLLGVKTIRLLSNNPNKRDQLQQYGLDVMDMIHTETYETHHNRNYLLSKKDKSNHAIRLI